MPTPLRFNPYARADYTDMMDGIRDRLGSVPQLSDADQDKAISTVSKLFMAEDAARRYGFRKAEVRALKGVLTRLAKKYDLTGDELRHWVRYSLGN